MGATPCTCKSRIQAGQAPGSVGGEGPALGERSGDRDGGPLALGWKSCPHINLPSTLAVPYPEPETSALRSSLHGVQCTPRSLLWVQTPLGGKCLLPAQHLVWEDTWDSMLLDRTQESRLPAPLTLNPRSHSCSRAGTDPRFPAPAPTHLLEDALPQLTVGEGSLLFLAPICQGLLSVMVFPSQKQERRQVRG